MILLHHYTIAGIFGFLLFLLLGFFSLSSFMLISILLLCILGLEILLFHSSKIAFLVFIFTLGALLGIFRMHFVLEEKETNHVIHALGRETEVIGKISEEVDIRDDQVKYIIQAEQLGQEPAQGKILVNAPKYPLFAYGDVLKIQGKLEEAKDEKDFSYKNYLSRYEIYGIMNKVHLEKIAHQPDSRLIEWLFHTKQIFLDRLQLLYPEPQASFLAGLLIGARKGLDEVTTEEFQKTGLTHIMAVSGSNITMLLAVIITLFSFLPRIIRLGVSIVAIILFTIFVGMSAAVIRAAIMGVIGLIAIESGRMKAPFIALLITIACMAAYQPKILLWDIGFQLSVAAIIGVIWLVPIFPQFLQKIPQQFGIKEAIVLTIAAQIATLPVSIIHFQSFSLIAPLANLLVVPLIPFAMLFGCISMIPIPFISEIFAFITFVILKSALFLVQILANIPFAAFENIAIPNWIWVLYSVILGFFMLKNSSSNATNKV